jgi:acyl-CoA hydrolase
MPVGFAEPMCTFDRDAGAVRFAAADSMLAFLAHVSFSSCVDMGQLHGVSARLAATDCERTSETVHSQCKG